MLQYHKFKQTQERKMINIYNNTQTPITLDYIVLEVGHNYIDPTQWAQVSAKDEIREMQGIGAILVNNYNDFCAYRSTIDILFTLATDNTQIETIKTLSGENRASQLSELIESTESNMIELELFHDSFKGIEALEAKYKIIVSAIPAKQAELEKLSKQKA